MAKQLKLTDREKVILGMSNHIKIIRPCKALVGITGDHDRKNGPEYLISSLLAITHEGEGLALRFNYQNREGKKLRQPTLEEYQEYMYDCKAYLERFVDNDYLMNFKDEKAYSPAVRMLTRGFDSSWDSTIGLYTMTGQKIPKVIESSFDINNLEKISKGLKNEDFHFSFEELDKESTKKISHLKLKDICYYEYILKEC